MIDPGKIEAMMNYRLYSQPHQVEPDCPKFSFNYREKDRPVESSLYDTSFSYLNLNRPTLIHDSGYTGIVTLQINLTEPFNRTFSIRVNTEHKVYSLQAEVKKVMDSTRLLEEVELEELEFRYSNEPVSLNSRIKDVLTISNFNRIDVVFFWKPIRQQIDPGPKIHRETTEDMIPYSSSGKYSIFPTFPELCRLSPEELSCLKNFRVSNEHGEVWFQDPIDVLGLDVDRLVNLEPMDIGITSKDLLADLYGFDKKIKFTFRGVSFQGMSEQAYKTKVLRYLQLLDGSLNHWDMASKTFSFTVNSNSLY